MAISTALGARLGTAFATWLMGSTPASESAGDKARAAGFLYGTGGLVAVVTLFLPHDGTTREIGVVGVAVLAGLTGAFLFAFGSRLAPWVFHVLTVCGTWMVAGAVQMGGDMGGAYSLFYIWVVLYVFYFFTPLQALGHSAVVALAAFTAVLFPAPGASAPEAHWLTTITTGVAAGVLVERLVVRIRRFGRSDYLTGLSNRRTWDAMLPARLRRLMPATVLLVDIDHFKIYNDEYGVRRGDSLLRDFGAMLERAIPRSGAVARYGGDELVALLPFDSTQTRRWIDVMRKSAPDSQSFSAGIAQWDRGEAAASVVVRADAALRAAKRSGRGRTVEAAAAEGPEARINWPRAVSQILEARSIDAHFQPLVRVDTRERVGYEALSRPRDLDWRGESVESLFTTAQFMGHAVDLDLVCHRAAADAAGNLPTDSLIFLNTSVATMLEPEPLLATLDELARRAGRRPEQIVIEVTERETVLNVERLAAACERIRAGGFRVALDDVGHARSSLAVLAAIQPDYIKITSELVASTDVPSEALLRALVQYGYETGAFVIAEGIEDEDTAARLERFGVPLAQGFLYGRPEPVSASA